MASLTPEQRLLAATGKFTQIKPTADQASQKPAAAPATAPASEVTAPAVAAPAVLEPPTAAPAEDPNAAAQTEPIATLKAGSAGASPTPGDEGPGEGREGKRFRFTSEEDQAIAHIAKSKGVSLIEATRIYAGNTAAQAPTAPAAQAPEASPPAVDPVVTEYDAKITDAKSKIAEIKAQRNKATEDLEHDKANELNDQLVDLTSSLKVFEADRERHVKTQEQTTRQTYQAAVDAARDRVYTQFPVFAQEESMERMALDAYVNRAIKDPKRAGEFKDPSWPEKLAKEFAAAKGITPNAAKPAGTAPVAPAVVAAPAVQKATPLKPQPVQVTGQPSGAKLLTGADGGQAPSATRPMTREQALERVRTDPEARKQVAALSKQIPAGSRR